MKYRNTKTGATFSSPFAISGGNWVKVDSIEDEQKEIIQETEILQETEVIKEGTTNSDETEINQQNQDRNEETNQNTETSQSSGTDFDSINKEQIIQELKAFGIEHNSRDKKQVLYDLMMQHGK